MALPNPSTNNPDYAGYMQMVAWSSTPSTPPIGIEISKTGAGLNDLLPGSAYTQQGVASFLITLSSTGTPDQFTWVETGGSGASGGPTGITGAAQTLADGFQITFLATTGHTATDTWTVVVHPMATTYMDSTGALMATWSNGTTQPASIHKLLSATHSDTTAASAVRGDIITAQTASPLWKRLAIGGAGTHLRSDGTDVSWGLVALTTDVSGSLPVANGGTGQVVGLIANSQGTVTYTTGVTSGTETTVYTFSLAGGSLGNNGRARFYFYISLQNPAANTTTYVVKIKIGAWTFVTSPTISPNANTTSTFLFEGGLVNQGATNTNTFYGKSSLPPITGDGTSTGVASTDLRFYNDGLSLNTASALTIAVTVTPTTGGSGNATGGKFKCSAGIIEVNT